MYVVIAKTEPQKELLAWITDYFDDITNDSVWIRDNPELNDETPAFDDNMILLNENWKSLFIDECKRAIDMAHSESDLDGIELAREIGRTKRVAGNFIKQVQS